MTNKILINYMIAKVITRLLYNNICCMNCEYYFANTDKSYCTIDNEIIDVKISDIVKCQAYSYWFGVVD